MFVIDSATSCPHCPFSLFQQRSHNGLMHNQQCRAVSRSK